MPQSANTPIVFDLESLRAGIDGVSAAAGSFYAEAAAICLESQTHSSGVSFQVHGDLTNVASVSWQVLATNAVSSWKDPIEATEFGACGIAILIVHQLTNWKIAERSVISTGFDYWLEDNQGSASMFQSKCRLEVSGIRNGTSSRLQNRVATKKSQVKRSNNQYGAIVVVVEFSKPQSQVGII